MTKNEAAKQAREAREQIERETYEAVRRIFFTDNPDILK